MIGLRRGRRPDRAVHLLVQLQRDEQGYPPFEAEEIDAVELGGGLCRLESAPTFARGLAVGDVVRAVAWEGGLWVDALHEPGGHSTMRVVGLRGSRTDEAARLVQDLGCAVSTGQLDLLVVDVPPGVRVADVTAALEPGRVAGRWDYDVGVDAGA